MIDPVLLFSAVTMAQNALIGDQLILEEEYDENYTPSEQGTLVPVCGSLNKIYQKYNSTVTCCVVGDSHFPFNELLNLLVVVLLYMYLQSSCLVSLSPQRSKSMRERLALTPTVSRSCCGWPGKASSLLFLLSGSLGEKGERT